MLEAFLRTGTSGSAWVHAPPSLAARESTRHRRKNGQPVDLAPLCFLFLSSPAGTPTVTCKHTKNANTTVDFNFFFSSLQICVFSSSSFQIGFLLVAGPVEECSVAVLWSAGDGQICGVGEGELEWADWWSQADRLRRGRC